jgi:2-dehydro-3-deoxygluconokinase
MSELVTFGETPLQFSPPEQERLETVREATVHADGTESNVAVAASVLGADSTWVSKLPDTPLGRRVVGQLHEHGIDTSITWSEGDRARQGTVFRETGYPPRAGAQFHDRENVAAATADPGDLPMGLVQSADVVFSGVMTPSLSEAAATTTEAMLRAAHGSGVTTAVDVDFQPGLRSAERVGATLEGLFEHLDVLLANETHVERVLDTSGQPRELANVIAAEHDLETVVITRSNHGAVALQNTPGTNVMHERETIDHEALDPAGQHAAFAGAFLQRLGDGDDLAAALDYGVAAATLARTIPGPLLTARREEIDRLVDEISGGP